MNKRNIQSIGEILKGIIDNFVSSRQKQSEQLMKVWPEILPRELVGHCNIIEFSAGILKVKVDNPCYIYELNLHRKSLLNEMNKTLTGVRVKDIKTTF